MVPSRCRITVGRFKKKSQGRWYALVKGQVTSCSWRAMIGFLNDDRMFRHPVTLQWRCLGSLQIKLQEKVSTWNTLCWELLNDDRMFRHPVTLQWRCLGSLQIKLQEKVSTWNTLCWELLNDGSRLWVIYIINYKLLLLINTWFKTA